MDKIKEDLTDVLEKLKKETFFGVEDPKIHPNIKVEFEYAPGKFILLNEHPGVSEKSSLEICFSEGYIVISYKEKNALTGETKDFTSAEIKDLAKYGLLTNYFRRDPRYVIENSKDIKETSPGIYCMVLWDEPAKKLINLNKETDGAMSDIIQCAEIYLENDNLKKMVVKTQFLKKSGIKERIFTDIEFIK